MCEELIRYIILFSEFFTFVTNKLNLNTLTDFKFFTLKKLMLT